MIASSQGTTKNATTAQIAQTFSHLQRAGVFCGRGEAAVQDTCEKREKNPSRDTHNFAAAPALEIFA